MTRTVAVLLLAFAAAMPVGAAAENSIVLVLDASGSMKARLPDGLTRIDGAKRAVAELINKLPANARLAFRAYGHQSPVQRKDCRDTELLVGFDAVGRNGAAVLERARAIQAQGYTPITHVLQLAAKDVAAESSAARVIVLVSDGKETCASDPCAAAKALADADAKLAVHTIGLGVDAAARFQLRCIASVARGVYVDAENTRQLADALDKAARTEPVRKKEVIAAGRDGKIRVQGATAYPHDVIEAGSGRKVTAINAVNPERQVPPGIYNVKFDNGIWQGVEVGPGETVVLRPGLLQIEGADLKGHKLLDPETGETIGEFVAHKNRIPLLPTRFNVTFSRLLWPELVEITEGATTTLRPGAIKVRSTRPFNALVKGTDGEVVGEISSAISRIALPPARYTVVLNERNISVELREGQDTEIDNP
jgi:hypothetical protein